jgi:membrane protein implicated in regulation of membrane protease activity
MEVSAATLWLIAGGVLFAVEVFIMPTMILAFAGMGAVITGILLGAGIINSAEVQAATFFGGTILSATGLWFPLKNLYGSSDNGYTDLAGQTAVVGEKGIEKGKKGEVQWSGSIWNARLSPDSKSDKVEGGGEVIILKVDGGVLIVKEMES